MLGGSVSDGAEPGSHSQQPGVGWEASPPSKPPAVPPDSPTVQEEGRGSGDGDGGGLQTSLRELGAAGRVRALPGVASGEEESRALDPPPQSQSPRPWGVGSSCVGCLSRDSGKAS